MTKLPFSTVFASYKRRTFTTDTASANMLEDVGVVGKRYPVNPLSRGIARHPYLTAITIVPPIIFFVIGAILLPRSVSYSLDDFQLSNAVLIHRSTTRYNDVMDNWAAMLGGEQAMRQLLDPTVSRGKPRSYIELRYEVDYAKLDTYLRANYAGSDSQFEVMADMLYEKNQDYFISVEQAITDTPDFATVCFTNNLEQGRVNNNVPLCVPLSSIAQYTYPEFDKITNQWHLNGEGFYRQENYLPFVFQNPSYGWFFDSNFSTTNQRARLLRTQIIFGISPGQSIDDYNAKSKDFILRVLKFVEREVAHPYINVYVGGGAVESIKVTTQIARDAYKIAVAVIICLVVGFAHSRVVVIAVYTAIQVVLTYFAACGVYILIYNNAPVLLYSAIVWIMAFGMHATLSFYDMFIVTGTMATKGRHNNLSLEQRVSFTMRRISTGVWVANVLAIIVFAINITSVFASVGSFSIFMMIAFLWNLYFITFTTPAIVVLYHLVFSGRRRNLQKQIDVANAASQRCQRAAALVSVLRAVDANRAADDVVYSREDDLMQARIGADWGANEHHYRSFGHYLAAQFAEARERLRYARFEFTGAVHKLDKTTNAVSQGVLMGRGNERNVGVGVQRGRDGLEDSFDPLASRDEAQPIYYNRRLVRPADLIHIPPIYTTRSEACWQAIAEATADHTTVTVPAAVDENDDGEQWLLPPRLRPLPRDVDTDHGATTVVREWSTVGTALGLPRGRGQHSMPLFALRTRALVRGQDPEAITCVRDAEEEEAVDGGCGGGGGGDGKSVSGPRLGNRTAAQSSNSPSRGLVDRQRATSESTTNDAASKEASRVGGDEAAAGGLHWNTLYWRIKRRHTAPRRWCCGLFGPLVDESAEMRVRRLMRLEVRREGYGVLQRLTISVLVPLIKSLRWPLFAMFVLLFVLVAYFGSRIEGASMPLTIMNDNGRSTGFAALNGAFGQRGTCLFCGPYYRDLSQHRTATQNDLAVCAADGMINQMNLFVDECGVCNGTNACVDCMGTVDGDAQLTPCGGCASPLTEQCGCSETHECSYCEWKLDKKDAYGPQCGTTEPAFSSITCSSHGSADQYSGACNCADGFAGTKCEECAAWLLPVELNPTCKLECGHNRDEQGCMCDLRKGVCTGCPRGKRGYNCSFDAKDCGSHGVYNADTDVCVCDADWEGVYCNASSKCNGHGVWLAAADSPTGEAMCACTGHWRGPTCKLCDCMNGGSCDEVTGQCNCLGTYIGARCHFCDATCVRNGICPGTLDTKYWDMRTCIMQYCGSQYVTNEMPCMLCNRDVSSDSCRFHSTQETCRADPHCWWTMPLQSPQPMCVQAQIMPPSYDVQCTCNEPDVYSGVKCERCLAGNGATCIDDHTVQGCNGLLYSSASEAMVLDMCGVCGGDGLCRGCDGVPGSALRYDKCGVCGGDGDCSKGQTVQVAYVDYLFDLSDFRQPLQRGEFADAITAFCQRARFSSSYPGAGKCLLEDFLGQYKGTVFTPQDVYQYAMSNGRSSEAVFAMTVHGRAVVWLYMTYRLQINTNFRKASTQYRMYKWLQRNVVEPMAPRLEKTGVTATLSSEALETAATVMLARTSLWFAVGIGMAVCFVFLLVYSASVAVAVAGTMMAGIVCFGSLTVCTFFSTWKLDAIMQTCISCTIPIGVEYVIHLISGYYDFLHSATSHLFARGVTRRAALQGTLLRCLPAICSSIAATVLSAIPFVVSPLLPFQRSGQICITVHLILGITTVLFSGTLAALGPLTVYQHWIVSTALCLLCGVLACVAVVIIYGLHGVTAPNDTTILGR